MTANLRALCREKDVRQLAVARALGVSPGTFYGYLSGKRPLPADRIPALCAALGCTPEQLAGEPTAAPTFPPFRSSPVRWDDGLECLLCGRPVGPDLRCICNQRRVA